MIQRSGFAKRPVSAQCESSISERRTHGLVGLNVVVLGGNYVLDRLDIPFKDQGWSSKGVKIGNSVWIGANTTILDGSVIGGNTIVAANSLVNRRYPANTILQGNPAKVILKRGPSSNSAQG